MLRDNKGFTLIELMVVVLIISILMVMAIPVYSATTSHTADVACQNNLRTIDGASAQYQAEFGVWPLNVDALVTAKYLKAPPEDPHAAPAYTIDSSGTAHAEGPLDHVTYPD